MNPLDLLFTIPILYALYRGFIVGFIMEICTLLAVLVGIYAGIHFSDGTATALKNLWDWDSHYMPLISFIITFLVVGACIFFGGRALQKLVGIAKLSPLNKLLGMLVSVIKMSYILSVLCVFIEAMNEKTNLIAQETLEESILYSPIKTVTERTIPAFNKSLIYWDYWYKPESDSTGLSAEQIVHTKKVADSLDLKIENTKELLDVYNKHVK